MYRYVTLFIAGCTAYLPESQITFDKFHVVKEVNKAMDELRKLERTGNELLKGHKYTFLKKKIERQTTNREGYTTRDVSKARAGILA